MTPFDPIALLSMLRAFYPVVSVAELQRALRERPEYFAGGRLVSTSGEKLLLPDGRIFDLIFDVEGLSGGPRWQVILSQPGEPDAFPLEPGPLTPIVLDGIVPPPSTLPSFEALVASTAGELAAAEGAMGTHEQTIAGAATPIGLDAQFDATIGQAAAGLNGERFALDALNPGALVSQTNGQEAGIEAIEREMPLPDDAPREIPDFDPGEIPGDIGPAPGPIPV